ncbi:hypothetical protein HK096_002593, partial [Nowakowskiella sp. JEL0078]
VSNTLSNAAALFVPNFSANPNWLGVYFGLKTIGIPTVAVQYPVVFLYTGINVTITSAVATTLSSYVTVSKGTLIALSQVPSTLLATFGLSASTVSAATDSSRFWFGPKQSTHFAVSGFNFSDFDDTHFSINDVNDGLSFRSVGYTIAANKPVTTLANYFKSVSNVATIDTSFLAATAYNNTGGLAIAIGIDYGSYYISSIDQNHYYSPYYVGQYYPGSDILLRIFKNVYKNAPILKGNYVTLHTVPFGRDLSVITTWDIDTHISYPHATAIVNAAISQGVKGSIMVFTKYVKDVYENGFIFYAAPYVTQFAGFGVDSKGLPLIDIGSHSTSHSPNAGQFRIKSTSNSLKFERGENVSSNSYYPKIWACPNPVPAGVSCISSLQTLTGLNLSFYTTGGDTYGEVRISQFVIDSLMNGYGRRVQSYRPGHLALSPDLSQVLHASGIFVSSSTTANDQLTHFPHRFTHNLQPFAPTDVFDFPIQFTDENGNMSSAYFPGSSLQQQDVIARKMSTYGGQYTLLIHPSGLMLDKIAFQNAFHKLVAPYSYFANLTGIGEFWRGRDAANVSYTFTSTSASVTVSTTKPVDGLTLRVPKKWNLLTSTGSNGFTSCQLNSLDGLESQVVLRIGNAGNYPLSFSLSGGISNPCPSYAASAPAQCQGYEIVIDDFEELWYQSNNQNLLDLPITSSSNFLDFGYTGDGRLKIVPSADLNNYWLTTLSKFCTDVRDYTHISFDVVAPVNSSFYVQLTARDDNCVTDLGQNYSYSRLVTDFVTFDGTNKTVYIPISEFSGLKANKVHSLMLTTFKPSNAKFFVDNVKIIKRCTLCSGTPIEGFLDLDRFIKGRNSFNLTTTVDNSTLYVYEQPGVASFTPASSSSFFETGLPASNILSQYSNIGFSIYGNTGATIIVSLLSSSGVVITSNTATIGGNITIPVSSTATRLRLSNFSTSNGKTAYRLSCLSLFGGPSPVTINSGPGPIILRALTSCSAVPGTVLIDFCSPTIRLTTDNWGDDGSMNQYGLTSNGQATLNPSSTSYWYYVFNTAGCFKPSLGSLSFSITAPAGASFIISFRTGCNGSATVITQINTSSYVTFDGTKKIVTIPFSSVTGLDKANLISVAFQGFSVTGQFYYLNYLTLI